MILQDNIEIQAIRGNNRILNKIFSEVIIGEKYIIPIEKLSKGSHYKIKIKCDCYKKMYKFF